MNATVLPSSVGAGSEKRDSYASLLPLVLGVAATIFGTATFLIQADRAGMAETRVSQSDLAATAVVADARMWTIGGLVLEVVGLCLIAIYLISRITTARQRRFSDRGGISSPSLVRQLRQLAALHAEGILADSEYEDAKRRLLEN
ncbi:SHOCT domain-containing protein [Rathayibacter sp. YIM 133350]|uniref:SHOCT domain-containing protein n=1 Tax=Rathayibacter sp. YIM 133350 TaxID=3131992 RepID=UPI00307D493D